MTTSAWSQATVRISKSNRLACASPACGPDPVTIVPKIITKNEIISLSFLKKQNVGFGGEIQLSDSIHSMAVQGNVEAVHMQGKRFDCGSIEGYINAIKYMALKI